MEWSEVILTIVFALFFGAPLLVFTLYRTGKVLDIRLKERRSGLSRAHAEEVRALLAHVEARMAQLESAEQRIAHLEEQVEFLQSFLEQPEGAKSLTPGET